MHNILSEAKHSYHLDQTNVVRRHKNPMQNQPSDGEINIYFYENVYEFYQTYPKLRVFFCLRMLTVDHTQHISVRHIVQKCSTLFYTLK
jgi:hypothetical protein